MKVVKKSLLKDGAGLIVLRAEDAEDMWHIYNLIHVGDYVKTTTVRKVVKSGVTGSTSTSRIRLNLSIAVESTDFDPSLSLLRVQGRNVAENDHVKMGAYHTLDLELNRDFTLTKNYWDTLTLERIDLASNVAKQADVAAVVMQSGLANVCLIKGSMTVLCGKIDMNIPRKKTGNSSHAKATSKFYNALIVLLKRTVDFSIVKVVLIASPGFVAEDFHKYLMESAGRSDDRFFLDQKAKFCLTHSSSGHKHALNEVLELPEIQSLLQNTKVAEEVKALDAFFQMMHVDSDRAYYSYDHVLQADKYLAIDTLMITDYLFRSDEITTRKKYVALVESVRDHGGKVFVFSSLHSSGEKLTQLSGIAALLRFPMPELEDDVEAKCLKK